MANRPAPALMLRGDDRAELERWTRALTVPAGLARRARIVLLAADGQANAHIAAVVGVPVPTVLTWRSRYEKAGVDGLGDAAGAAAAG
jgi:Homeodomain-like domain